MFDKGTMLLAGLAVLGLILSYWVYVTFAPSYIGAIYAGMCLSALLIAAGAGPIGRALGNKKAGASSPPLELGKQAALGFFIGIVFIGIAAFSSFAIGIPSVQYASAGSTGFLSGIGPRAVQTVVAPLSEELFFFFVIPFLVYSILVGMLGSEFGAVALTLLIASSAFALYHYRAYGATLLLSGAFIAAGGFRLIVLLLDGIRGKAFQRGFEPSTVAPVIITAIVMHAMFNIAVVVKTLVVAA